ncbi:uncharacterized protein C7orf78 homolog [Gastrophryne carolinensis]
MAFMANETLAVARSNHFSKPKQNPQPDIWKKKPPDFSVRLYRSLALPRKSNESGVQEKIPQASDAKRWKVLDLIPDTPRSKALYTRGPEKFQTKFKHIGPFEASLEFVKDGVYPKDLYQDPKPHDFRQVASLSPLTFYLNVSAAVNERAAVDWTPRRDKVKSIIFHKPVEPAWDPTLILPKSPWPPKSASYTRHRRRRGVYSAFMDRVEEKFTASNQEDVF